MVKNPVMFVVEVGAVLTTVQLVNAPFITQARLASACRSHFGCGFTFFSRTSRKPSAEDGAKHKQTPAQRRAETQARLRTCDNKIESVPSAKMRSGGHRGCRGGGDFIPGDGEVIEGVAFVG